MKKSLVFLSLSLVLVFMFGFGANRAFAGQACQAQSGNYYPDGKCINIVNPPGGSMTCNNGVWVSSEKKCPSAKEVFDNNSIEEIANIYTDTFIQGFDDLILVLNEVIK